MSTHKKVDRSPKTALVCGISRAKVDPADMRQAWKYVDCAKCLKQIPDNIVKLRKVARERWAASQKPSRAKAKPAAKAAMSKKKTAAKRKRK